MGVSGQHHATAALSPVAIVWEVGWAAGPVLMILENLAPPPPTEFRSLGNPARTESLYLLNYHGSH